MLQVVNTQSLPLYAVNKHGIMSATEGGGGRTRGEGGKGGRGKGGKGWEKRGKGREGRGGREEG